MKKNNKKYFKKSNNKSYFHFGGKYHDGDVEPNEVNKDGNNEEPSYDELLKNIDNLRFMSIYGEITEDEAKRITTGLYAFHQQKKLVVNRSDPDDFIEYCEPLDLIISTQGRLIC